MRPASGLLLFLSLVLVLPLSPASAVVQSRVAAMPLPTSARPTSLAEVGDGEFLIGTLRRNRFDELLAIDAGADGRSPSLAWSLDVGARVNAIAVDGMHAYLATADDTAELVVVDLVLRQRVGSFDVPGTADGDAVSLVAPGVVELVVRRNSGPERYRLDVAHEPIAVLAASDDPTAGRRVRPEPLRRYRVRGRLIAKVRHEVPGRVLYYLLATERAAQFQVIEEIPPLGFRDRDGDGVYRLGCVGDSNTSTPNGQRKWCEILRDRLFDPDFAVINVAVSGATVNPNFNPSYPSDAAQQMAAVLTEPPDAVVLAFGTNDFFQGRTPQQIHDAYVAQQATADAAGVGFYVATTPPIIGCACATIAQTNDLLRATFAGRVLEFNTGFGSEHFETDGFHCNVAGQQLRADRAVAAFVP